MDSSARYRTDIDGLRAVSIIPVVLYHAGIPAFSGGYVGVDVFFVISGFLIAGIISRDIEKGRFSIVHFYERRARRILPALFLVVAATILAALVIAWPADLVEIAESAIATVFFSSNFYFWQATDYFATASEYQPLLHTWSLAVEEQFYIFFPLFLLLMARMSRRWLLACSFTIFAVSLFASVVSTPSMPVAAFYLAPVRAWELFLGVFLALNMIPAWSNRLLREAAACLGILMILFAVVSYDSSTSFPGIAAVVPCIGAALVVQAGRGDGSATLVARLLSARSLVFLGLISYSLYLWHWPVLAFSRSFLEVSKLPAEWTVLCVTGSLVLAAVSWRFVERPFRTGQKVTREGIFRLSGTVAAILVCLSVSAVIADGYPGRVSSEALAALEGAQDIEANRMACMGTRDDGDHCVIGSPDVEPSGMLVGDSHAAAMMSAIDATLEAEGLAAFLATHQACPPVLHVVREGDETSSECEHFTEQVLEFVEANRDSLEFLILTARWPFNATGERAPGESGDDVDLALASQDREVSNSEALETGLRAFVDRVTASGVRVILLGDVPEIGWDVPRTLALARFRGVELPDPPTLRGLAPRYSRADAILRKVADNRMVTFIPVAPLLCRPACQVIDGSKPVYIDDDHLSEHGARKVLGPRLVAKLGPVLKP